LAVGVLAVTIIIVTIPIRPCRQFAFKHCVDGRDGVRVRLDRDHGFQGIVIINSRAS
jgi:hypothetical protein